MNVSGCFDWGSVIRILLSSHYSCGAFCTDLPAPAVHFFEVRSSQGGVLKRAGAEPSVFAVCGVAGCFTIGDMLDNTVTPRYVLGIVWPLDR